MSNTITGRILSISPTQYIQTRKGENLPKRELVLDCTYHDRFTGQRSQYENTPQFEFASDLCAQLDQFQAGQIVTISFDVQGNRYTNRDGIERIFTRLRPYRIEAYGSNTTAAGNPQNAPYAPQTAPAQPLPQPLPQTAPQAQQMPLTQQVEAAPQQPPQQQDDLPF